MSWPERELLESLSATRLVGKLLRVKGATLAPPLPSRLDEASMPRIPTGQALGRGPLQSVSVVMFQVEERQVQSAVRFIHHVGDVVVVLGAGDGRHANEEYDVWIMICLFCFFSRKMKLFSGKFSF